MDIQQTHRTFALTVRDACAYVLRSIPLAAFLALAVAPCAALDRSQRLRHAAVEARLAELRLAEANHSARRGRAPSAKGRARGAEGSGPRQARSAGAVRLQKPKRADEVRSRAVRPATVQALTIDDFRRAAGLKPAGAAETPAATFATGESHPDHAEAMVEQARRVAAVPHPADAAPHPANATAYPTDDGLRPEQEAVLRQQVEDAMLHASVRGENNVAAARSGYTGLAQGPQERSGNNLERAPDAGALVRPTRAEMAEAAVAPRLPGLYTREGQLVVPAPLKGSHEVLVHQNEMAQAAGLNRIQNNAELEKLRARHQLVSFTESAGLRVNPELPEDRRCARPWAVQFAQNMARAFYAEFHEPLYMTSAVRTVAYQRRLERVNGNAAATAGEGASPHLTGQALDFGKRGMSLEQIAWMRAYLLPLMQAGKLDVEEEFQQACFHISVYRSYAKSAAKTEVAALREKQGAGGRD